MTRALIVSIALFAACAQAQDMATYNKALTAFNASNFEDSARGFYEVFNTTTENDLKLKSEYYLATSFQRLNMPFTAFIYYAPIVSAGPSHPFHLRAVEALVVVQNQLNDDYLIPSFLEARYDKFQDSWATLPIETLARINYLIGRISHRRRKLDDAKLFFEAVPPESQVYAKAQYMLGITLADPGFKAATEDEKKKNAEKSTELFDGVLKIKTANQQDLTETHQLATLALGRVYYNLGEYQKAVKAYETIPRFSKYWDQALFENGFARFQNDDLGGALGSLQALHAPQFAGAFQPESWILKSTAYYFSCLHQEAKGALIEFEKIYLPMAEKLKPIVEQEQADYAAYFKLVDTTDSERLPKPVLNWVRSNERMLGIFAMMKEVDSEKATAEGNQGWKAAKLTGDLVTYLDQNRGILEKVAGNFAKARIAEAFKTIKGFSDQAEIIRFETAKAEKEFAEQGIDQRAVLAKQTLYRPAMPAENWNYWRFEGEFWRDEIGYYQYTLKKACPSR